MWQWKGKGTFCLEKQKSWQIDLDLPLTPVVSIYLHLQKIQILHSINPLHCTLWISLCFQNIQSNFSHNHGEKILDVQASLAKLRSEVRFEVRSEVRSEIWSNRWSDISKLEFLSLVAHLCPDFHPGVIFVKTLWTTAVLYWGLTLLSPEDSSLVGFLVAVIRKWARRRIWHGWPGFWGINTHEGAEVSEPQVLPPKFNQRVSLVPIRIFDGLSQTRKFKFWQNANTCSTSNKIQLLLNG